MTISGSLYPKQRGFHEKLTIALTGGFACGKSTAVQGFAKRGAFIIDADEVARTLLTQDACLISRIVNHFGTDYLDNNHRLNRLRLQQLIFQDISARLWRDALIHPPVYADIQHQLKQLRRRHSPYAIVTLPVFFENPPPLYPKIDRILVISAPESSQIQRALARSLAQQQDSSLSETQIKQILASQLPLSEKIAKADDLIINDGNLANLDQQVQRYHQFYLGLTAS